MRRHEISALSRRAAGHEDNILIFSAPVASIVRLRLSCFITLVVTAVFSEVRAVRRRTLRPVDRVRRQERRDLTKTIKHFYKQKSYQKDASIEEEK